MGHPDLIAKMVENRSLVRRGALVMTTIKGGATPPHFLNEGNVGDPVLDWH